MRRLALTLLLFLPLDAVLGQSASIPTTLPAPNLVKVFASFDSVTGDPTMSYKDHPDMTLAACSACGSAGQVMVATGPAVEVYDTSGRLLKTQTTENFIRSSGIDFDAWKSKPALPARAAGKVNDPRVTYDPFISRWIVVCSCSGAYLMVSGDKDATGTWKGVVVDDEAGDLTMFPAWDRNGVYISKFQQKLNSRIIALPSSDVAWRGKKNISLAHEETFDQQPYEIRPAIDRNPKKKLKDPEYLVARSGPPVTATNLPMDLLIDKIAWSKHVATISGPITISTGFLYNTPTSVSQLSGSPLRGDESHRVFSVVAYRDHLHVIEGSGPCTSNCGPQSQDANNLFYWFDIDTGTMTFSQKSKVSDPTLSLLFPSMALDGNGNVGIGMTGMSSSQHPSIYLFTSRAANGTGNIDGPFLMHGGTDAYTCDKSPNAKVSWGTHSSTVQDGSNAKRLWTIQEYAGSATPCVWKTRVIGFEIQEPK